MAFPTIRRGIEQTGNLVSQALSVVENKESWSVALADLEMAMVQLQVAINEVRAMSDIERRQRERDNRL